MTRRRRRSNAMPVLILAGAACCLVVAAVVGLDTESTPAASGTAVSNEQDAGTAVASASSGSTGSSAGAPAPGPGTTAQQTTGGPAPVMGARTLDLTNATDVDLLSTAARSPDAPECRRPPLITESAQSILFGGLETIRAGTRPMEWERERELGAALHRMLTEAPDSPYAGKIVNDPQLQTYLDRLVDLVASYREQPQIEYQVFIVDDPMVNAFATLGGYMYFTTGIIGGGTVTNEAALMGVMAHEMGHIDRRHAAYLGDILEQAGLRTDNLDFRQSTVILGRLGTATYSRELEDESDRYAYDRLIRIGYSPFQMENWFWEMFRATSTGGSSRASNPLEAELENLFASHSSLDARACNIRRMVRDTPPAERTYRGTQNYSTRTPAEDRVY